MFAFIYISACTNTYVHTYIKFMHACMHAFDAYIRTYVRTYVYTYKQRHTHTFMEECRQGTCIHMHIYLQPAAISVYVWIGNMHTHAHLLTGNCDKYVCVDRAHACTYTFGLTQLRCSNMFHARKSFHQPLVHLICHLRKEVYVYGTSFSCGY